jgi:choline dehydrogenase-like flavoprotein
VLGFIKALPEATRPDAQIIASPFSFNMESGAKAVQFDRQPGAQIMGYPARPQSRGSITIRSADPREMPIIRPNYLTHEYDRRVTVAVMRFMRKLLEQPALKPLVKLETTPGASVQSDDEILDVARRTGQSGYHATGTCKMGLDTDAVLDPRLRVRGVQGLRVMDCSVLPSMVSATTNGPVMAMAWRAADLILEDAKSGS